MIIYYIWCRFRNINRLFVVLARNDPKRDYFDKCCISLEEINGFNALIDNKLFFDQPVKKQTRKLEERDGETMVNAEKQQKNINFPLDLLNALE